MNPPVMPARAAEDAPIPQDVLARHEPPLECYYCARDIGGPGDLGPGPRKTNAMITVHDQRGCTHVCFEHAKWRMKKAFMHGHSRDCPHHESRRR